jgi:hypothetical protein
MRFCYWYSALLTVIREILINCIDLVIKMDCIVVTHSPEEVDERVKFALPLLLDL